MHLFAEVLISALLVIGGSFALIGSYGLIKLRDGMQRLHAPTKGTTVGVGAVLIASSGYAWLTHGSVSMQELLILLFLFLTAPLTALFLSKVQLHEMKDRNAIPATGCDTPWATFDEEHDGPEPPNPGH
ncbi:MAG: Na+/H+ antiporter subunit G [Paracoccaceae bacterium]